jgi:hypothetical protein
MPADIVQRLARAKEPVSFTALMDMAMVKDMGGTPLARGRRDFLCYRFRRRDAVFQSRNCPLLNQTHAGPPGAPSWQVARVF